MAIIVEDGSIVANSNSYIDATALTEYATNRGITIAGTPDELLYLAMDYVENQNFKGNKKTKDQTLQWPRTGVYVDGFLILDNEIPQLLQDAQAEAALSIDRGEDPLSDVGREIKREKLDVMEIEYMSDARSSTIIRKITAKLRKLIEPKGRVVRG